MSVRLFLPRRSTLDGNMPAHRPSGAGRGRGSVRLEIAALLGFATAIFLTLALLSCRYDPYDPNVHGQNWVGPVGGSIARVLVQGFGLVAWFAPLELLLLCAPLLRGRKPASWPLRFSGDLVLVIIFSALAQVAFPNLFVFGQSSAGGNVGLFFGELMRGLFSTLGSFVVGGTLALLILIGNSEFSFIQFCQGLATLASKLALKTSALAGRLLEAWRQARRLRYERLEESRRRLSPRIDEQPAEDAVIAQVPDEPAAFPFEVTGPPPLALSERLKMHTERAFSPNSEVLPRHPLSCETEPDSQQLPQSDTAPVEVSAPGCGGEDSTRPKQDQSVEPRAPARRARSKGPRIIDTKPQQQIERVDTASGPRVIHSFVLPTTDMLSGPSDEVVSDDHQVLLEQATLLEKTLSDYGISGKVEEIHPGPTVTTYEVVPQAGTKVSKVASLCDDLALGLSRKVRIIAPIPGKSRIGFELPNDTRVPVNLRELVEDVRFEKLAQKAPLPVVLGRDIVGAPYYADLASMPHVIVAGATGAGKSVGLNVMLTSMLFKRSPDELRLLMIDPKVVELAPFDGIPHMLLPVVTDMKQAATALKWAVDEMERRYQLFANAGTKNIQTYNRWVERVKNGEVKAPAKEQVEALTADGAVVSVPAAKEGADGSMLPGRLPYIVTVVDEFADLMMQQGKDVEASVARLAQKARAAGMHVVLATQRPSVDVITGMIKANFPSRIAFRVAQKVDSRTILDEQGAELLLGRGDMLVKMNGFNETRRVQCPFISEEEVNSLTVYLRSQGEPQYHDAILKEAEEDSPSVDNEPTDARFDEAVRIVADTQRCSTSWLQRKMTIGYNRAAKIVEMMEKLGMVGPANGARDREVYVQPQ